MVEIINNADFLKNKKDETAAGRLDNLLRNNGREIAGGVLDFFGGAFVDIADGASCAEWHRITPDLEIWVTLKRRC